MSGEIIGLCIFAALVGWLGAIALFNATKPASKPPSDVDNAETRYRRAGE